jgi:hypothetical protein
MWVAIVPSIGCWRRSRGVPSTASILAVIPSRSVEWNRALEGRSGEPESDGPGGRLPLPGDAISARGFAPMEQSSADTISPAAAKSFDVLLHAAGPRLADLVAEFAREGIWIDELVGVVTDAGSPRVFPRQYLRAEHRELAEIAERGLAKPRPGQLAVVAILLDHEEIVMAW